MTVYTCITKSVKYLVEEETPCLPHWEQVRRYQFRREWCHWHAVPLAVFPGHIMRGINSWTAALVIRGQPNFVLWSAREPVELPYFEHWTHPFLYFYWPPHTGEFDLTKFHRIYPHCDVIVSPFGDEFLLYFIRNIPGGNCASICWNYLANL